DQCADDVGLGFADPGTQQALPDGTHAECDHQEHEPDSNRPQVDHAVCHPLVDACRRGSPMQIGLSEASPAEYLAPRDHPGISQNDEKERPSDSPVHFATTTSNQEGHNEDAEPE